MNINRFTFFSIILSTLIFSLSSCGGQPITFNGNPASSSSTDDTSSESSSETLSSDSSSTEDSSTSTTTTSSSSRSSSSSTSSTSSVSSGPTGAQLYVSLACNSCHGSVGQGGAGGSLINCGSCGSLNTLSNVIRTTMPRNNIGSCNLSCATKIAQFMIDGYPAESPAPMLKQAAPNNDSSISLVSSGDDNCGIAYSTNDLSPSTKQEYTNAVKQLTGVNIINDIGQSTYDALPSDGTVSESLVNSQIILDNAIQKLYSSTANQIAEQLSARSFDGIVNCTDISSAECYNRLIKDFGCKAFKRPLNLEEQTTYLPLYTLSGTKGVISALLSSPNFIFKSNIGLVFTNQNASTQTSGSLLSSSKTLSIFQENAQIAHFTGDDTLEITVSGSQNAAGLWPTMRIQAGFSAYVDIVINHESSKTYSVHISGLTADNMIAIINQQTGAPLEYQSGHNLTISDLKLSSTH